MTMKRMLTPAERANEERWQRLQHDATMLMAQNRLNEAQQMIDKAVQADDSPWASLVFNIRVQLYNRQGRYHEAAALLDRAYGPHPLYGNLNIDAATAFAMTGRTQEALHYFKPVHFLVYRPELTVYFPRGSDDRAVKTAVFLGRGIVDTVENQTASALWALTNAARFAPENPLVQWYLGKALAATGDTRAYFQQAIRLDRKGIARRGAQQDLQKLRHPAT